MRQGHSSSLWYLQRCTAAAALLTIGLTECIGNGVNEGAERTLTHLILLVAALGMLATAAAPLFMHWKTMRKRLNSTAC